eukprot:6483130-Amphidinium_carterae.1
MVPLSTSPKTCLDAMCSDGVRDVLLDHNPSQTEKSEIEDHLQQCTEETSKQADINNSQHSSGFAVKTLSPQDAQALRRQEALFRLIHAIKFDNRSVNESKVVFGHSPSNEIIQKNDENHNRNSK